MNEFSFISDHGWWFLLQLALAVLYGGLIGGERQHHGRPAGLRTHILVCLGSAGMIIAFQRLQAVLGNESGMIRMDPARAAAGIITGIGFLGAGTIIKGKDFVMGLTTAASIWVVAAIGIALGLGESVLATAVTLLVLGTLLILGRLRISTYYFAEISLEGKGRSDLFHRVQELLPGLGLQVKSYGLDFDPRAGLTTLHFVVRYRDEMCGPRVVDLLSRLEGVTTISWK